MSKKYSCRSGGEKCFSLDIPFNRTSRSSGLLFRWGCPSLGAPDVGSIADVPPTEVNETECWRSSGFSCRLLLSVRGFVDYAGSKQPLANNVAAVLPSSFPERSQSAS
jgi:hypothetical protein